MLEERKHSERKRMVTALVACAAALTLTVTMTHDVSGGIAPSIGSGLAGVAD